MRLIETAAHDMGSYGSFKDSLRAPIHRWFTYPAGYSYKLVECKIDEFGLTTESWIGDPFVGTGTTSIVAKIKGVNSIGIEAHPFVHWIASTKMCFQYDLNALYNDIQTVLQKARANENNGVSCKTIWPELVYKCFNIDTLIQLFSLREAINSIDTSKQRRDFLKVALTATLRIVTSAGAGWPYIAPSKFAQRKVERCAYEEFSKRCRIMLEDISSVAEVDSPAVQHLLINGDARKLSSYVKHNSVDLILTSPPYLNNYDYADRTRLESYFWGIFGNWSEITNGVRDHLITAATTQIRRTTMNDIRECPSIQQVSNEIHGELMTKIIKLSELRTQKSGKKSYDLLVAGYFEDMLKTIKESYAVLKKGCPFVLVLGDSAPYGIHVATDELIGRLGVAVGFSNFSIEVIRKRGEKWSGNTQRHKVPLRESIVTITK